MPTSSAKIWSGLVLRFSAVHCLQVRFSIATRKECKASTRNKYLGYYNIEQVYF